MSKTNMLRRAMEGWVLVESPAAKSASNEEASKSDPESDPEPSVVCGEEFVADFTLYKNIFRTKLMSIIRIISISLKSNYYLKSTSKIQLKHFKRNIL